MMAAATCSTPLKLPGVSGPSSMPPRSCRTCCGTCDLVEKASIEHTRPSIACESIDGESGRGDRENGSGLLTRRRFAGFVAPKISAENDGIDATNNSSDEFTMRGFFASRDSVSNELWWPTCSGVFMCGRGRGAGAGGTVVEGGGSFHALGLAETQICVVVWTFETERTRPSTDMRYSPLC